MAKHAEQRLRRRLPRKRRGAASRFPLPILLCLALIPVPSLAQDGGAYRDPACGLDGGAVSEARPKPMTMHCEGSNRFGATFPGDVWTMSFDYDPCGELTVALDSAVEKISFPAGPQPMTVFWRAQDSLSLAAHGSFAGVEIAKQGGKVTLPEHADFGVLAAELDFAAPDVKIYHLGGDSPSLPLIDNLERELLRSFLKAGFVECRLEN